MRSHAASSSAYATASQPAADSFNAQFDAAVERLRAAIDQGCASTIREALEAMKYWSVNARLAIFASTDAVAHLIRRNQPLLVRELHAIAEGEVLSDEDRHALFPLWALASQDGYDEVRDFAAGLASTPLMQDHEISRHLYENRSQIDQMSADTQAFFLLGLLIGAAKDERQILVSDRLLHAQVMMSAAGLDPDGVARACSSPATAKSIASALAALSSAGALDGKAPAKA